jgi:hypothetical protein
MLTSGAAGRHLRGQIGDLGERGSMGFFSTLNINI